MVAAVPFAGGVGVWEIVLLVMLALLLFGTKKLPQLGRSAGKGMREFKGSVTSMKKPIDEVTEAIALDDVKDIAALAKPKTALARILTDGDKDKAEKPAATSETQADT
jgi:sec-independent protein translocase protein TatA